MAVRAAEMKTCLKRALEVATRHLHGVGRSQSDREVLERIFCLLATACNGYSRERALYLAPRWTRHELEKLTAEYINQDERHKFVDVEREVMIGPEEMPPMEIPEDDDAEEGSC
jgi:hypothetical protein